MIAAPFRLSAAYTEGKNCQFAFEYFFSMISVSFHNSDSHFHLFAQAAPFYSCVQEAKVIHFSVCLKQRSWEATAASGGAYLLPMYSPSNSFFHIVYTAILTIILFSFKGTAA